MSPPVLRILGVSVSTAHPEIESEQQFVDRAYALLDKGLADGERSMADFQPQHRSTARAMQRALHILRESRGTGQLVFGKMETAGQTHYIGRRRVRDEDFGSVVVGWHAAAAQPFYEASATDPADLTLKRVFTEHERILTRVFDEIVHAAAAEASGAPGTSLTFSDALIEELERSRDGAMRDVVATIQTEQYRIIRHPLEGVVVVQGGPGTGKTVVGLHRAAWLAFNYQELRRAGILVVAPSTNFLTYVSAVLPSLDVTDVDQVEIQALYAGEASASSTEDPEIARVKGDSRMATLLSRALEQRVGWGEEDLVLALGADRIRLDAADIVAMVEDVRRRDLSHSEGRDLARTMLSRMAADSHREEQQSQGRPMRANEATIRRLSTFANALDRMWPTFTPEEFLRTLYGTQSWLVRAADGLLTADDRARLYRPQRESVSAEPWTEADLYCLDEIAGMLTRDVVTYGHLVVDEAQDLSPMQARTLARRCPSGSFTVLGDLAQTTSTWVRDSWSELTEHLGDTTVDVLDLSIGYRVPAPVLELAARQLPLAGPDLAPPQSIRTGHGKPAILHVEQDALTATVVQRVTEHLDAAMSTAAVVGDEDFDEWATELREAGLTVGDGRDGDFSNPFTLVPASGAKGLEFDAVVLVEPAAVVQRALQPPRALYVAMTRCTQSLTVVHARALPDGFPAPITGDPGLATSGSLEESAADDAHLAFEGEETTAERLTARIDRLSPADLHLVAQLVDRLLSPNSTEDPDVV